MAQSDELTPQVERERVEAARGAGGLEGDWPPDWMVTYSDMTTILMTFFVLWYALTIAKVDQDLIKMREKEDERIIQGMAVETRLDLATEEERRLVEKFQMLETDDQRIVLIEMQALREKAREVRKFIAQGNLENDVRVELTAEDVVIIPTAPLIFSEGEATINPRFHPILDKIAWLLKETDGSLIRIEGHTDTTPIHPRHRRNYPSNWELSAARAVAIARYLIVKHTIPEKRISTAAYGPSLPKVDPDEPGAAARNRRVEFHIFISSDTVTKED